jgi:hypothetical protein
MKDFHKQPLFTAEEVEAAFKEGVGRGDRWYDPSESRFTHSTTRREIMSKLFKAKREARA